MTNEELRDQFLARMNDLPDLRAEPMFGGYAIYCNDKFFAIVKDDKLYFRVTEVTREQYLERGAEPFAPTPLVKLTTYYEVPREIAADDYQIKEWARKSLRAIQKDAGPADHSAGGRGLSEFM